jgi:NADH-quinone oxidoreductase subunit G
LAKIVIDGKTYEVNPKKNLLEACLSLGLNLPYFCWHPQLGSVGACRQCAVIRYRDEKDTKGRLVMSCMEPVQENMIISIDNKEAKQFRKNVIEWLMTNHPHDCPVCDEGGECHLQDMTVMTGHSYRRFKFKKRTYRNQYLGPFVNHEMNRCIQCYRCVRFYKDYAGGKDLDAFAVHNNVYFGRHEEGLLENEFSGNLVEVCPTGVFTDKTLKKNYTRKWDLTNAPSICHQCSAGCNIIAAERYGKLRRILSRYNGKVNGYFLCDRGRFGYEYVNHPKRFRNTLIRNKQNGNFDTADKSSVLKTIKDISSSKMAAGIGSPRASLESNFALKKLVGEENFYHGVSEKEYSLVKKVVGILKNFPLRTPSQGEIKHSDAVLIIGEDLTNTAPMLALAVRQAAKNIQIKMGEKVNVQEWNDAALRELAQDAKSPVYILASHPTKLDEIAAGLYYGTPDEISRMAFAAANIITGDAPDVSGVSEEENSFLKHISDDLINAERPLIISGTSLLTESVVEAAANVALALKAKKKNAEISFVVPEANSMGLALMNGEQFGALNKKEIDKKYDTVFILENDLYRKAGKEEADSLLNKFKNIIVIDHTETATSQKADFILPAGTFAESDGTLINQEGRAQRFYQVFVPKGEIHESWRWLNEISQDSSLKILSDFTNAVADEMPLLKGIKDITPPPGFRIADQKFPREPHRFSGRTAMHANINVSEPKPPDDPDTPMTFTMEGYRGEPPSSIIPFFWSPGWNSAQAINKYQIEVGGPLHGGDPGSRIFELNGNSEAKFFTSAPGKFSKKEDEWLVIPLYHIFGSDELSALSPAVKELMPECYVALNPDDASKLNLVKESKAEVNISGEKFILPVKIKIDLPEGTAAIPAGLPDSPFIQSPSWIKIRKAE